MSGDAAKKKANMELAIKADACYTAGDYAAALEVLHRIEKSIGDKEDTRLLHNLRLTESAVKGFKDAGALRAGLLSVKAKIRAKHAAKHGSDTAGTPAANQAATSAAEGPASGGAEPSSVAADVQATLALLRDAESDCSILLYNLAAMHFERAHYGAARTVLEHLFRDVEPMEEMVAVAVCLLLLDVLVHCARGNLSSEKVRVAFARQTEEVLGHLEKLAALSTRKGDSVGTDGKPAAPGAGEATSDAGGAPPSAVPFTPEQVADLEFRVHLYRAKVLLMQAQLKAAKKEIKSALEILQKSKFDPPAAKPSGSANGSSSSESAAGGEGDWASSAPALRSMTALYLKANFEYLRTNYRKALKLLSSCHTTGAMLQQLEGPEGGAALASGSSGGGIGQASSGNVGASCVATTGSVGAMYFNNVACVHHKMRKYHAALHYFQRAIASDNEPTEGSSGKGGKAASPPGSSSPGLTRDGRVRAGVGCEVRYNAGLALLLVGQPQAALVKFDEAASLLFDRPQLWLRMAECCVQHYCQHQLKSPSLQPAVATADGAVVSAESGVGGATVAGSHAQRRFVWPSDAASDTASAASSSTGWLSGPWSSSNQCSLAYAVACLHNALFLLAAQARDAARREEEATEGKLGALFGKKVGSGAGGASTPDNGANAASSAAARSGADEKEGDSDEAAAVLGLEAAAYLNLAFVHLSLGDPAAALAATASLLEPRDRATAHAADGTEVAGSSGGVGGSSSGSNSSCSCPPALRTLAHMYAAEALVALNKPAEALEHLNVGGESTLVPEVLEGTALKLGAALATSSGVDGAVSAAASASGGEGAASGLVVAGTTEPSRVQAALYANVACAALVQQGADKNSAPKALAEKCARAAVHACPSSSHAQRTLVYVLLRTGQTTEALAWLKLYRTSSH